jgi:hypothetical protein
MSVEKFNSRIPLQVIFKKSLVLEKIEITRKNTPDEALQIWISPTENG